MKKEKALEKLSKIIEENPDCHFVIDNSGWWIEKNNSKCTNDDTDILADSNDFEFDPDWYSGDIYGAGLSAVLLYMMNKRGFNITVSPC